AAGRDHAEAEEGDPDRLRRGGRAAVRLVPERSGGDVHRRAEGQEARRPADRAAAGGELAPLLGGRGAAWGRRVWEGPAVGGGGGPSHAGRPRRRRRPRPRRPRGPPRPPRPHAAPLLVGFRRRTSDGSDRNASLSIAEPLRPSRAAARRYPTNRCGVVWPAR